MQRQSDLKAIRRSLNMLLLIALFVTCYFAKDLLLPVLLGFLLALTLSPVTRWLSRRGIPFAVSSIVLVFLTTIVIGAIIYLSAGTVSGWMGDADNMRSELQGKLRGVSEQIDSVREASDAVTELAGDSGTREVIVAQPTLLDSALSVVSKVGATLAVTLVLATFLLSSGTLFYSKLVQSFKTFEDKKRALAMVFDIERQVSRYLLTITVINAGLGVVIGTTMALIGLDYPHIWGFAAFLLNFMPYLGGFIGSVMVGLYAVITFDSLGYALLAPLAYQFWTTLEGQFVTPVLVGRRLELNTVAVFLTVVLWGWLWGIAGALVAVPFLVVFKTICDNVPSMAVVANFLGAARGAEAELVTPQKAE